MLLVDPPTGGGEGGGANQGPERSLVNTPSSRLALATDATTGVAIVHVLRVGRCACSCAVMCSSCACAACCFVLAGWVHECASWLGGGCCSFVSRCVCMCACVHGSGANPKRSYIKLDLQQKWQFLPIHIAHRHLARVHRESARGGHQLLGFCFYHLLSFCFFGRVSSVSS